MNSRWSARDSSRSVIALAGLVAAQHISLAAFLEVEVGQGEAVQRLGDGLQPLAGRRLRADPAGEQAQAGMLAAADPAAQLMQLADAEPVGVHHQHHGRVGHVDADLDDGGAHQHIDLAGAEGRHHGVLLVGRQPPVHQPQPQTRPAARTQPGVQASAVSGGLGPLRSWSPGSSLSSMRDATT